MKIPRTALTACAAAIVLASAIQANAEPLLENFDNVGALTANGWVMTNNSSPLGTTGWFQGDNTSAFTSHAGADNSYVAANFNNADFGGNIDNWLISPVFTTPYEMGLTFFTRVDNLGFNDKLEVRLSTNGASANLADFTTILVTITDYPDVWTKYSAQIAAGTTGRIAFRYLVTDTSVNGDYIGIDSVRVPEPMTMALVGLGLVGLAARRRQS